MKQVSPFWALALCLFFISGCGGDGYKVDVSKIDLELTTNRLDQDLFAGNANQLDSLNAALLNKYGSFYTQYLTDIIRIGTPQSPMIAMSINEFRSNPAIREIQQNIQNTFPDFKSHSNTLQTAFKRYRYFFPEAVIPTVVTYNGGFNYGIYPTDSTLGIGLEWYLGADNEIVSRLAPELFPQYKRDNMATVYLEIDAVKGWLMVHNADMLGETLLDQMIFHGKMLFITKALLADKEPKDVLSYSTAEWDWCNDNEYFIWTYLVQNQLIYSKEGGKIAKLMSDGPFTSGMPPESPGGVGKWVGYQMVNAFMRKHGDVSPAELLKIKDARVFLENYKPAH